MGCVEHLQRYREFYREAMVDLGDLRVQLSLAHSAEVMWERLMMDLVGEDGPKSVREKIEAMRADEARVRGQNKRLKLLLGETRRECFPHVPAWFAEEVEQILQEE